MIKELMKQGKYELWYRFDERIGDGVYELYVEYPWAKDDWVYLLGFYSSEMEEDDEQLFWEKVDKHIEETLGYDIDYDLYLRS